jgi:nitric oxide reductase activation protein
MINELKNKKSKNKLLFILSDGAPVCDNSRIYRGDYGVYDTNKRVTEAKQKTFRGIVEFIGGDYVKFARITP